MSVAGGTGSLGEANSMNPVTRVDIESIENQSEKHVAQRHNKIRAQLSRMERATIQWTRDVRGNWPNSSLSFSMPLQGRLKLEFYEFYQEASNLGAQHVARENRNIRRANVLPKSRMRGATSARVMIARMEIALIEEWMRSTNERSNQKEIDYYTRLVFSKFGGWNPPEPP